jgi:hypothetical protein
MTDALLQPIQSRLTGSEVVVQQQNVVRCPVEIPPRPAETHAWVVGEIHAGNLCLEKHAHGFEHYLAVVYSKNSHGFTCTGTAAGIGMSI